MPKLFAGSLMKGRDFTWQQIFGLCIFPTTGSQRNYSRAVALLDCTALLLVAHAKGQEHVPVARAIDGHRGHLPSPGGRPAGPRPNHYLERFQRRLCRSLAPSLAQFGSKKRRRSAHPHHQRDRRSWLESRSLLCSHSPREGLAFLGNAGSDTEVCNFILPPPFPPHHLWTRWLVPPALASSMEGLKAY